MFSYIFDIWIRNKWIPKTKTGFAVVFAKAVEAIERNLTIELIIELKWIFKTLLADEGYVMYFLLPDTICGNT